MLKLNSGSPLRSTSGHIRRALGSSVALWYSFVKRHHSNISARVWRGQISHRLYELGEKGLRKHVTKALQMWHPCETFRCCTQKTQSTTANPSFFFPLFYSLNFCFTCTFSDTLFPHGSSVVPQILWHFWTRKSKVGSNSVKWRLSSSNYCNYSQLVTPVFAQQKCCERGTVNIFSGFMHPNINITDHTYENIFLTTCASPDCFNTE